VRSIKVARGRRCRRRGRVLSDEAIARMQPNDVLGIVGRDDLTAEDRRALNDRLRQMQGG
jgi:hypothetical protein